MRFLCYLALLLLPSLAAAQNQFGARLGLNVATVTGDFVTSEAAEPRVGFVGGFTLAFPLRYSFTLQAEVLYAQKGFTTGADTLRDLSGAPVPVTSATFELTTLDLPLLVKFGAPLARDVSLHPYGGFYLGFELAERLRVEPDFASASRESDDFSSTDFGFIIGLDASFVFRGLHPTLGVRFSRSLSNQLEENASDLPDATAYNSVLSVLLGFRL